MRDITLKHAYSTILLQVAITLVLAVLWGIFSSPRGAYSAVLGGLPTIIPALIFVRLALTRAKAEKTLQKFFLGELAKFLSMAILFVFILLFIRVEGAPFMLSFVLTQIATLFTARLLNWRLVSAL